MKTFLNRLAIYYRSHPEILLTWVASVSVLIGIFSPDGKFHDIMVRASLVLFVVALVIGVINYQRWLKKQRVGAKQLAFFEQQVHDTLNKIGDACASGNMAEVGRLSDQLQTIANRYNREAEAHGIGARIKISSNNTWIVPPESQ